MSTILYENEKFLKIYQTMKIKGTEYACLFGYPDDWQHSMPKHYQQFVDDLRTANIKAYNARYDDGDELEYSLLDFSQTVMPYETDIRFYQSLRGLRYNLDDAGKDTCAEMLNELIGAVGYAIISRLPEYETANTW